MQARRYFKYDRNYLLQEAQLEKRDELLNDMVKRVVHFYQILFNPLGLMDDLMIEIQSCKAYQIENLFDLYDEMCGIYRFQYGSNQLELLFDGSDHKEKYAKEWSAFFENQSKHFCLEKSFLKAIIESAILFPKERKADLAANRLRAFVSDRFAVKIYKHKGIVPMQINKS